jgi:hypothetical protein
MWHSRSRATASLLGVLLAAPLGGLIAARRADPDPLSAIRKATARYRDVKAALADGYIRDPMNMCVTPPVEGQPAWLGAMGVHYFRPDILGITSTAPRVNSTGTNTDFMRPGVLLYEPQADGSLQLVAVENLVFEKAWRDAGHTAPPSFEGHEFFHMVDNPLTPADEAHGFEPHYELHIWTERENPSGMFMEFNPNVTCKYHTAQPAR